MKTNKGYAAIASVLVIAAVVVIIGSSVSLLSVTELKSSLAHKKSLESLNLVESCVEEVLLRLNEDNTVPSSSTLPEISCSVTINSQNGNNWDLTVLGSFENYSKSIRVVVNRDATIAVTSWKEE